MKATVRSLLLICGLIAAAALTFSQITEKRLTLDEARLRIDTNKAESAPGGANMIQSIVSKPPVVSYFEKAKVDAGFAKGTVLFDGNDKYQVHTSRREKAGVVEVHEKDADIMYFLSGTATLVTGGEALNVSNVGPGEIRGTDIKGGETRKVGRGDVIIIPAGTPHWFKEVPGPLTYYTVKAR